MINELSIEWEYHAGDSYDRLTMMSYHLETLNHDIPQKRRSSLQFCPLFGAS
jgi:hypothetical protein